MSISLKKSKISSTTYEGNQKYNPKLQIIAQGGKVPDKEC